MSTHTASVSQAVRVIERESFLEQARALESRGARLVFMYATDDRATLAGFSVNAVFDAHADGFVTLRALVPAADPTYPSLTTHIMAAHWYERLMHDQFGIVAQGHPDWRRLVHHENIPAKTYPLRKDFAWNTRLAHASEPYPMHAVEGKGVYEIPVGPIHAGIIEPGHFRFNVRGERILTLEGKLFFKHKGVEKLVEGKTPDQALPFVERISGDGAVGHALAFCEAVERATSMRVPERAAQLRVLWLELERTGAHLFDLGNIGGMGTGFTFMAAQCFRMLEGIRRLNESLTGHRYLRGAITLGGAHDLDGKAVTRILAALDALEPDIRQVLDIAYATDGLMERFETTGVLTKEAALAYGARGVAARASGVDSDMRRDHPTAAYDTFAPDIPVKAPGDVRARFSTRVIELEQSIRLIRAVLGGLTNGAAGTPVPQRAGESLGWCESFRGAIIDWVRLDEKGRIDRLAISDPSFMNWPLFGELGPGNIVPDFPLCNKSLNLSYSGTDL